MASPETSGEDISGRNSSPQLLKDFSGEAQYLRDRIEMAERVVAAARNLISPTLAGDRKALVFALYQYADFLSLRPDRWRNHESG